MPRTAFITAKGRTNKFTVNSLSSIVLIVQTHRAIVQTHRFIVQTHRAIVQTHRFIVQMHRIRF
jgi:hypothetical protein